MLKQFTNGNTHAHDAWGNGHTPQTDPTRQGWRCRPAWDGGPLLIGPKGIKGCATLVPLSDGEWDVAVYDDSTPEEVIAARCNTGLVAAYHTVRNTSGFGLAVIRLIAAEMSPAD